jgi:hypothetical protein
MTQEGQVNAERQAERSGQTRPAANSTKLSDALSPETVAKMKEVVDYFLRNGRLSRVERKTLKNCFKVYADGNEDDLTRWLNGVLILYAIKKILEEGRVKPWQAQ